MKTYFASIIITAFMMFILILLVLKNSALSKSAKIGIIITSVFITVGAFSEFIGVALDKSGTEFRYLHIFVKFLEFSITPIIPIAFSNSFYSIKQRYLAFIPAAVHIVIEFISIFSGLTYYVDAQNTYHHGPLYPIYYLTIIFGVIFLICTVLRYESRFQNRTKLILAATMIFVLMGTIWQAIDSSVKIVWLTVGIGFILFFIYYCTMISQIDALTELLNRRTYKNRIETKHSRAIVMFFDINNFKEVNDQFGHSFGDNILSAVASALRSVYGKSGLCYRIGGDEFCVIIDRRVDSVNVEKLNGEFDNILKSASIGGHPLPSVAVGYAVFDPSKMSFQNAIAEADRNMYLNKKQNR